MREFYGAPGYIFPEQTVGITISLYLLKENHLGGWPVEESDRMGATQAYFELPWIP